MGKKAFSCGNWFDDESCHKQLGVAITRFNDLRQSAAVSGSVTLAHDIMLFCFRVLENVNINRFNVHNQ